MMGKNQVLDFKHDTRTEQNKNIAFFNWVSKREILALEEHDITRQLLSRKTWELGNGRYKAINQTELFSIVSEVNIERLNLSKNKCPNILRQIKDVTFSLLTKLLLNDNHITSLQFLDHLDSPRLQAIALMNNKIIHLRSFKKTKFPQLNYIALQNNHIQNFSPVSMMESGNFIQLLIELDSNDKVLGNDISWISKIKSCELREINYKSSNRINLSKTKTMLANKFQQLQFEDKYKSTNS